MFSKILVLPPLVRVKQLFKSVWLVFLELPDSVFAYFTVLVLAVVGCNVSLQVGVSYKQPTSPGAAH